MISRISTIIAILVFCSSCASVGHAPVVPPTQEVIAVTPSIVAPRRDTYHVVAPSETLWRISKMYDVSIEDIMAANNLRDATKIKMGRKLLIPDAAQLRPVIPLYKSDKWKYVIIHHSATDIGDALSLNKIHLRRGFWNGLGYHFIIDNGTSGKANGQIEVAPRWIKQMNGAHCKAAGMNTKGIGICLVGNFSQESVSKEQMDSLVFLVDTLKKYYHVSERRVMGHSQVPGAATECPGLKFPWDDFWYKLRAREKN